MSKSRFHLAALVFLAAILATNVYRAATQSIVHDEALTWELYLAGPASMIFQYYDPNNHFLATILFRLSAELFGVSAFSMRLPTLLAGAWFLWTAFQLCVLIVVDGWPLLVALAALTLNPLLLDFLVAARGYGLAIAGLFWGLYQMLAWSGDRAQGVSGERLRRRLWKAALGLSVAVAANLTMLIPAFALAATFSVLLMRVQAATEPNEAPAAELPSKAHKKAKNSKPKKTSAANRGPAPVFHFLAPVAVLALIYFLAAPIDTARARDFYVGTRTAAQSLQNLTQSSFEHGPTLPAWLQVPAIRREWLALGLVFLPAVSLAALIATLLLGSLVKQPIPELATLLASVAVVGSAALLALAHLAANLPYPADRTGLYFVPMATLCAVGLAATLALKPGLYRLVRYVLLALLVALAAGFAAEWNTNSFLVWPYDADTKQIFEALEKSPRPPGPIRLGVSWELEPALNFYRVQRGATWLSPVERDGFDGVRQFYAVTAEDRAEIARRGLRELYRGPVSGTVLAAPAAH